MLLTLLLLTIAAAEWVEISQQHYRKPMRTHSFNPFTTPDKFPVEETTKPWANNRSVTEYNWNKARQPNGNVKRVQLTSSMKPTEAVRIEDEYADLDDEEFEVRTQEPTKPTVEFSDNVKQKATITRVPNVGNVKRVQLSNTPVKSPFLNVNDKEKYPKTRNEELIDKEKYAKTRYEELPLENEQADAVILEHKRRDESKTNIRRIYINEIKNQYSTEPISTLPTEDEYSFTEGVIRKQPKTEFKNRSNMKHKFSTKPTFITEEEDFNQEEEQEDRYYKVTQTSVPRVTEKKHIFTTQPTNFYEDVIKDEKPKPPTKQTYKTNNYVKHRPANKSPHVDLDNNYGGIVKDPSKSPHVDLNSNYGDIVKDRRKPPHDELGSNRNDVLKDPREHVKENEEPELERSPERPERPVRPEKSEKGNSANKKTAPTKQKKDPSKGNTPDNKVNNMENLVKLMKVVADTISHNSRRSFGGKMRYLHELKDTILGNIAERIDDVWPDDDGASPHRRSRSAHTSARGHHVHFPSSESALMTISFLTFAVFLIKLVLQVIHTYKNKTMMVAPVMVATAGRTLAHRGQH